IPTIASPEATPAEGGREITAHEPHFLSDLRHVRHAQHCCGKRCSGPTLLREAYRARAPRMLDQVRHIHGGVAGGGRRSHHPPTPRPAPGEKARRISCPATGHRRSRNETNYSLVS